MSDMFDQLCPGERPEGTQVRVGQLWTMAGELYLVVGLTIETVQSRFEKNRNLVLATLFHSDGTEMKVSVSLLDSLLGDLVRV